MPVISGERPVSWGVSGYRAIEARADGSPIEIVVWDEGVALAQFIGVVPAKAPHPNAARLFYRWLMTPEGQELLVTNANLYSPRKDVAVTPLKQPPLSSLQDQLFQQREDRRRRSRAGGRVRQGGRAVAKAAGARGEREALNARAHRQRPRRAAPGMAAQHHRRRRRPHRRLAGVLSARHHLRDGAARRGRLVHARALSARAHRAGPRLGAGQLDHHQRRDHRASRSCSRCRWPGRWRAPTCPAGRSCGCRCWSPS